MGLNMKREVNAGDRFGMSVIIEEVAPIHFDGHGSGHRRFRCKCDCGKVYETDLRNLTLKRGVQSCGCYSRNPYKNGRRITINQGDKYGKLTVIKEVEPTLNSKGHRIRNFLCKCDCGGEKVASLPYLRQTHAPSCGCYADEIRKQSYRKKYNTYETDGEVTKVYDEKGNYALIDTEDLEKIKPYYFYKGSGDYYVANKMIDKKKVSYFLHRLVTDCPKGLVVDHLNHNRADNRKENLKICTLQDNRKNMPVIGVVLLEHTNKWTASIKDGDSIKYLGVYDTFDEAVEAFRNGA